MDTPTQSIFTRLYSAEPFVDRYLSEPGRGVDVVIPVMHTNELWRKNLCSIYREIPVSRLLVSDDGCVDDSIDIARSFPRVTVLDHRSFTSLGFSLRKLIEAVDTEWFVYLHSDVYLPQGWFDDMCTGRANYDWFESAQRTTVLVEIPLTYGDNLRPVSGSQMGRKAAFEKVLPRIDDDYLYRNEDIIISQLITDGGFRYGRVASTACHHQLMDKKSKWARKVSSISIGVERSPQEEVREYETQLYGLLKYLRPNQDDFIRYQIANLIYKLIELKKLEWPAFERWIRSVNPGWWVYIARDRHERQMLRLRERTLRPIVGAIERIGKLVFRVLGYFIRHL